MPAPPLPEQFLRYFWQSGGLSGTPLATTAGNPVQIVSPGILNIDGGPDFRDAVVCIGGRRYRGDVELHIDAGSWYAHGHAGDPHYNRVILHVVWDSNGSRLPPVTAAHRAIPVLAVSRFLPADAIEQWRSRESAGCASPRLRCFPGNGRVHAASITAWLESLGQGRFRMRVRLLEERLDELVREQQPSFTVVEQARDAAWDQLLYECVMEGLGYEKNRDAFLNLSRSVPLEALRRLGMEDPVVPQAVLFGAAGLLPDPRDLRERESRRYVRTLRKRWHELRPLMRTPLLHEGDWLFFRLRPPNFPTARLASLAFLLPRLFEPRAVPRLAGRFAGAVIDTRRIRKEIGDMLTFTPDAYWAGHLHFRRASRFRGIALGRDRVTDLTVNALLPVVWMYARAEGDVRITKAVAAVLKALPAPASNAITRRIERDLLLPRLRCTSVLLSQGALELSRRYCREGRCGECAINPEPAAMQDGIAGKPGGGSPAAGVPGRD